MRDTLLLNADGNPLSVAPLSTLTWQESIKLIWLDRINVLEWHDDWQVHSPSVTLTVPSVIIVRDFVKRRFNTNFSRSNVYLRDNYMCQYCKQMFSNKELTLDHVIPRSLGGKTTWTNIVSACKKCNNEKASHTHIKPYKEPRQPDFYQLVSGVNPIHIDHEIWYKYINKPTEKKQKIA
jgi:5-methylcytosine-specific restriction endonuclease McrA